MSDAAEHGFRTIVDALPMGIVVHRERRVVYANRICIDLLGVERLDELVGRDPLDLVAPDERDKYAQRIAAVARGETIQPALARVSGKEGRSYDVEVVGYSVEFEGQPAIVTVARDVTEQKRLEEQFQQAQKMESIGRLASGVAHDFNNLVTVILSCAEALRQDVGGGSVVNPEDIDEIEGAGERARELTSRLLALARKQVIEAVPLDLNAVVRRAEKLLRRVLRENVELVTKLDAEIWSVRADPGLLEQVVHNLAVNAQDAMPNGGRLSIDTANAEVDEGVSASHPWMRAGQHVRLTARDTGHGMSPEVKAHLFEPFFTTKPTGQGTGLGLATVHSIVKQSGGFILVQSAPDVGTTFEIYLPRTLDRPIAASAPGSAPIARGHETVLVLEDDPQVREVTVRSLQAAGYGVLAARDVQEALAMSTRETGRVDLLISDVILPGGSGPLVAEGLRRRWPELKVLYISGYGQDAISEYVPDHGVELLQKPFTASSLLARMRSVLGSEQRKEPGRAGRRDRAT